MKRSQQGVFFLLVGLVVFCSFSILRFHRGGYDELYYGQEALLPSFPKRQVVKQQTATERILLMGQSVGSITRMCVDEESHFLLTPIIAPKESCPNQNSPSPVRPRRWMHPDLQKYPIVIYYSSHVSRGLSGGGGFIQVLGGSSSKECSAWTKVNITLDLPQTICNSVHSPYITVDDDQQRLYMYAHGHHCTGLGGKQPTLVLHSHDGVSWDIKDAHNVLLEELFYLTSPVNYKGEYYALAKTQESPEGSVMLLQSQSLEGPFVKGPILARGVRHCDVHIVGSVIYVFFTMIGDAPERILLATIDLAQGSPTSLHFLPGPTVLTPTYSHEHGNSTIAPSKMGPGSCTPLSELRDPHFLPDENMSNGILSGSLFYTVQGERAFALARVSIDLEAYADAVKYRNQSNIHPQVLQASSLERGEKHRFPKGETLITGTGRSGTTYLCTFYNALGLSISHDNDEDCGRYPGKDGAVSWYDGFDHKKRYNNILHVVRMPLDTIQSRALKMISRDDTYVDFMREVTRQWESDAFLVQALKCEHSSPERSKLLYRFSLQHWVNQNAFVEKQASWRERIEDLSIDPLAAWRLCAAGRFGNRCPNLKIMRDHLELSSKTLNSLYTDGKQSKSQQKEGIGGATNVTRVHLTWAKLEEIVGRDSRQYLRIARQMSARYGYEDLKDADQLSVDYKCNFEGELWKCSITTNEP